MTRPTLTQKTGKARPRTPVPRPAFDRVADALADRVGSLFVRLGAGLVSFVAILLCPIRLKFITMGAAVVGFWLGARDEFRLIREEWRQEREERRRLGRIIEAEWQRFCLTSPEALACEVGRPFPMEGARMVPKGAKRRREELLRAGLDAIERDQGIPPK